MASSPEGAVRDNPVSMAGIIIHPFFIISSFMSEVDHKEGIPSVQDRFSLKTKCGSDIK